MNHIYKIYFSIRSKFIRITGLSIFLSLFCTVNIYSQEYSNNIKIGVVFSESTWQQLYSGDYKYFFIQHWEIFLMNHRMNYTVFTDNNLDDFNFDDVDVLILPGVEILSDDAVQNIFEFLKEGKSVLLLGNGGHNTSSMRIGFNNFLKELTGCTVKEINHNNKNALSININYSQFPGVVLKNRNIILQHDLPVYFTDNYNKNLAGGFLEYASDEDELNTAILFGKYGKGRFAWFGFQISQLTEGTGSNTSGESLILNTLNYLSGYPILILNDFPGDYHNAVLIVNKIRNKPELKKIIKKLRTFKNFKTDFYINPFLINDQETNLTEIADYGAIHLLYDPLDFLSKSTEFIKNTLAKSEARIKQLTNQNYIGIWREDSYYEDAETDSLNFGDFNFQIKEDKIIYTKKNSIGNDTIFFNLVNEISDPDGNFNEGKILIKSEKYQLLFLQLNNFIMPDENFTIDALNSLLIKLASDKSWLPSLNEMLEWTELKQNILYSINESVENKTIKINISNNNFTAVKNLNFRLILREDYFNEAIEQMTNFYFDYTTNQFYLKIDRLKAYENKSISIAE